MQESTDSELLLAYSQHGSEAAFAMLVQRYLNLVYSTALRKTGNTHAAEEITQAVFILLARKAARLREGTVLSGWLYQAARLTAATFLRTEFRRTRREHEASLQAPSNETESAVWAQLEPLLEDAMGKLNHKESDAIALRFFEGKGFKEIGRILGASENAAKKRVQHGLEKLRLYFAKRSVASTTAIIAGAISAHSVHAAPAGLAKTVSAVGAAQGAAASSSTLALVKGALKFMAWTKTKIAVVAGAIALIVTTTAVVGLNEVKRTDDSQGLSSTGMDQLYTITADGKVNIEVTLKIRNVTNHAISSFSGLDDVEAEIKVTDASGHPMKSKRMPGRGSLITFNRPIAPGETISCTMKARAGLTLAPTPSGEYLLDFEQQQGNTEEMQLTEVWRLPAGAVLVTKKPADMTVSTNNNGQIEVRLDKILPPNGTTPFALGYRLADRAN